MGNAEKPEVKQNGKAPGKKQMLVLWTAVLTALGSQGVPKIVELLENKPSVEQVQEIVTSQTEKVTDTVNELVGALKVTAANVQTLEKSVGVAQSKAEAVKDSLEFLQEVLMGCCTRRDARKKLEAVSDVEAAPPMPANKRIVKTLRGFIAKPKDKKPLEHLQKLPKFDVQQQLQLQEEK